MKSGLLFLTAALVWPIAAQTPASNHLPGTVTAINPSSNQITLKTEKGDLTFTTSERTQIVHAQAGISDPRQWPKLTLGEIANGDEVVAYYRGALEQKPLLATSLVVRTKADLSQLAEKELEDWKKRGTSGNVTAVDPAAKTITLKSGPRTYTVQLGDKTVVRRYSPDSAKPADAKPGTLADIKIGDQANVLGNKGGDGGTTIAAEMVYAGTFRQIAAVINSVDPATGEMKVTDLLTKKPLTIRITPDTTMRKLQEQMAQMLARRYQGGRGGAPAEGRGGQDRGEGRGAGFGGGRGGDIGSMLDRLPAMPLTELKPKDAIMVSTTSGSDPSKVTAVTLLAGVEPILTAAPSATRDIMSGWNLGGGGGGEGQ
jgi:Cu/Ag efflux protein CusF